MNNHGLNIKMQISYDIKDSTKSDVANAYVSIRARWPGAVVCTYAPELCDIDAICISQYQSFVNQPNMEDYDYRRKALNNLARCIKWRQRLVDKISWKDHWVTEKNRCDSHDVRGTLFHKLEYFHENGTSTLSYEIDQSVWLCKVTPYAMWEREIKRNQWINPITFCSTSDYADIEYQKTELQRQQETRPILFMMMDETDKTLKVCGSYTNKPWRVVFTPYMVSPLDMFRKIILGDSLGNERLSIKAVNDVSYKFIQNWNLVYRTVDITKTDYERYLLLYEDVIDTNRNSLYGELVAYLNGVVLSTCEYDDEPEHYSINIKIG